MVEFNDIIKAINIEPYYRDWQSDIVIYNADCRDILPLIPDKSIDLVLTDPPYGISKDNNFSTMEPYNQYKGMDFGEWDKKFNQTEWLKLVGNLLNNPSSVLVFNSWQNISIVTSGLENSGLSVKRIIVIRKTNPMPVNRDRLFTNSFEFAVWATGGTNWIFNRKGDYETGYFECKNNGETEHPTEKQISVISELVRILSNNNSLVLDPFLGSGTTAVACKVLGRKCIGIELEEKYCEIAKKRLAQGVLC